MNIPTLAHSSRNIAVCAALSAFLVSGLSLAAQNLPTQSPPSPFYAAPGAAAEADEEDEIVELSPFTVDAGQDEGYRATNTISGTRLNTSIKDAPLPIEVITNEFMRDTGATNLREALQYSAGVILDSQNDAFYDPQAGQDDEPGSAGANDPGGVTSRNTETGTKLRGYTIEQTLRDGFRRQAGSDWINIERVEVVRGPEALLYGVGSFGGVYNYVPKRPTERTQYYGALSVGTNSYKRVELDASGPLAIDSDSQMTAGYRVTAAWQDNGDHTEHFRNRQFFVSPVFQFRPFKNTTVLIDNEFSTGKQTGNGFQSIRLSSPGSGAQQRGATFWPGSDMADLRTFRWSGPDTFLDTSFRNHVIDIEQRVGENFYLKAGVALSHVDRDSRDITNTALADNQFLTTDPGAFDGARFRRDSLETTIPQLSLNQLFQLVNDPNIIPEVPRISTFRYKWSLRDQEEDREQVRVEAAYSFEGLGRHSLLAGVQTQYRKHILENESFVEPFSNFTPQLSQQFSFHNPDDLSKIRFGTQGDGVADPPMVPLDRVTQENWDLGYYLAYHGRFFEDRLTIIGGYRYDRSDARNLTEFRDEGRLEDRSRSQFADEAPTEWSPQIGASVALTEELSVFGLYSTGLIPNYDLPNGVGDLSPTTAKNIEAGIKFELMEGRLSGTISAYKIERKNTPRNIWWAPAPYKAAEDPTDPNLPRVASWRWHGPENLWYAVNNTPDGLNVAKEIFSEGWHPMLDRMAAAPASPTNPLQPDFGSPEWGTWGDKYAPANKWNGDEGMLHWHAVANTDVLDTLVTGEEVWWPIVNLDNPAHEQFAITALESMGLMDPGAQFGWSGNFYEDRNGTRLRFADGSVGVRNIPHYTSASVPLNDESKGFDAQFILTPTENWQIIFNYAHVRRKVTSQSYQYVETPYYLPVAQYYYPVFGWGTLDARPAAEAYADVTDTSTFQVPIPEFGQTLDDTPENMATVWSRYRFEDGSRFEGLGLGMGFRYEDRRQYYSGFAVDGTANAVEINGERVFTQFWTDERYTVDLMVDYETRLNERYNVRFALNVYNLLDDQGRYGFVFAPGRSARLTTSVSF